MSYATLTPTADGLAFRSSYDPALVAALKAQIPYQERRWDPDNKCWLVAPGNEQTLAAITAKHLGVTLRLPQAVDVTATKETRLLDVRYIGAPKERSDGTRSAFGYCEGEWSVIFPEDILKNWFELGGMESPQTSGPTSTLYGLLGARRDAGDHELKRAYRKMAKRWHPDVSQEDDAAEMFKRINDAYQILSDARLRKKYDAGLTLEASLQQQDRSRRKYSPAWRPPVRCGHILAEGTASLGRFLVGAILQWEDITDVHGRILVTSWPAGANHFTTSWI